MWHELVLCGIGGKTIEEAQKNISYAEFCQWVSYRGKRGTLNIGLRIEEYAAMIAQMYSSVHGKQGSIPPKIYDFAPHLDEPELTIDDMKNWK